MIEPLNTPYFVSASGYMAGAGSLMGSIVMGSIVTDKPKIFSPENYIKPGDIYYRKDAIYSFNIGTIFYETFPENLNYPVNNFFARVTYCWSWSHDSIFKTTYNIELVRFTLEEDFVFQILTG